MEKFTQKGRFYNVHKTFCKLFNCENSLNPFSF